MAYTEAEARRIVVEAGRKLLQEGLVARTWGNVSARVSESQFVITPSGMAYDTMTEEQLVLVDGLDDSWQGPRKPSSERGIHADAYRLHRDVNVVIHTHQDMASVCRSAGRPLVTDHPLLGGRVPCAEYGLPSTDKLRRAVARELAASPGSPTILLRSHGALCLGRDMAEAFAAAAALEAVCRQLVESVLPPAPAGIPAPDLGKSLRLGNAFRLTLSGEDRIWHLHDPRLTGPAALHAAIYRTFDAKTVTHWRGRHTVAVSRQGKTLRPLLDDLAQIAGADVRCVAPQPSALTWGLWGRNAVLLAGQGALCTGSSPEEAAVTARLLEKGCLACRFADAIPGCRPLEREDALLQRLIYVTQYATRKG